VFCVLQQVDEKGPIIMQRESFPENFYYGIKDPASKLRLKYLYFCFFVQNCAHQLFVNLFLSKILLCNLNIVHFP
jgi:hypothetical protein